MRPLPTVSLIGTAYSVDFPHANIFILDEPIGTFWGMVWFADTRPSICINAPTQDKAIHLAFNIVERG